MEIVYSILTSLLASTMISAAMSFVLKTWFESRLKHYFAVDLERLRHSYDLELEKLRHSYSANLEMLRNELSVRADAIHEITERRLALYPRIVELVYRTRNIARTLSDGRENDLTLIRELDTRVIEMENTLYASRLDLERDDIFVDAHLYKILITDFSRRIGDFSYYQSEGDTSNSADLHKRISEKFKEIEKQHRLLIGKLSDKSKPMISENKTRNGG